MTDYAFVRVVRGVRSPANWIQLAQFSTVGASGYAVNLAVYTALLHAAGLHYLGAAVGSFLVAVTSNYTWNRLWTFRAQRGHVAFQGMRFLVVSLLALSANLAALHALVTLGVPKLPAQALAVVVAMPLNFMGNKLWCFADRSVVNAAITADAVGRDRPARARLTTARSSRGNPHEVRRTSSG